MSQLSNILHPQLIDNLSMGLHSRFNIKGDVKEIIAFISKFGCPEKADDKWVPSGFPIGKVQSMEHLEEVKLKGIKENTFYNITTGKYMKEGNQQFVYFTGYCVKRNVPEHLAILKAVDEDDVDSEEESIHLDEKNGYEIIEDTNYIYSSKICKIVGRMKGNEALPLSQKYINIIKNELKMPWVRLTEDELEKHKLV